VLRQYVPKRVADLNTYSQDDFDAIAAEPNGRPRKTLGVLTPSQKFNEAVQTSGGIGVVATAEW
jgi:transposase, IS30 family